eukprot:g47551.t1
MIEMYKFMRGRGRDRERALPLDGEIVLSQLPILHPSASVLADRIGVLAGASDSMIDLLEALNITRSIKGVSRSKGLEPGFPAWKFRNRVPHLTLPRDYAIYFLTSMQGSIGFHFVAKQSRNSEGTVISFTSPTITKKDGQPLLQLVSSTRSNQLRLDYRTVHNMEPASVVFPGGTPFGNKQWGRVAFNLEAQKITLFIDCEEDIIFEKTMGDDAISLILPIDLEIHFSSTAGDHSSKFTHFVSLLFLTLYC